jgi:hypothetical protein
LRASWQKRGDLLIVDHHDRTVETRFELIGSGSTWLGPHWRLETSRRVASQPKPGRWNSDSQADLLEWSYRAEGLHVRRMALLLRDRKLALLGEELGGRSQTAEPWEVRFGLPAGISVEPVDGSRALLLRGARKGSTAQALPLALPALPYKTERGGFSAMCEDGCKHLCLKLLTPGRRCFLPLLVSWDANRHRKRLHWRILTVSERAKKCPSEVAFAVRVSWGKAESYVIYRSLAAPAQRAFLGHQTTSRFLLGEFKEDGTVNPLVSVD